MGTRLSSTVSVFWFWHTYLSNGSRFMSFAEDALLKAPLSHCLAADLLHSPCPKT